MSSDGTTQRIPQPLFPTENLHLSQLILPVRRGKDVQFAFRPHEQAKIVDA